MRGIEVVSCCQEYGGIIYLPEFPETDSIYCDGNFEPSSSRHINSGFLTE